MVVARAVTSNPIDNLPGKRVNQSMTCVDLALFVEWTLRQGPLLEHGLDMSVFSILG